MRCPPEIEGVLTVIGCCYMPNGNPQPRPKFAYKLDWFKRFNAHAAGLMASGHPAVLADDYNVVPTDADIFATRSFKGNALLQPEPRTAYQALLEEGWTDALHHQSPQTPLCTFRSLAAQHQGCRADEPGRQRTT